MRPPDYCLLGRKKSGVVTDGLVLWLDGINNTRHGHDETATSWEDLSGNGNDFAIYGHPSLLNDGYYFVGDNNDYMETFPIYVDDVKTIECVFSCESNDVMTIFHHDDTNSMCIEKRVDRINIGGGSNCRGSFEGYEKFVGVVGSFCVVKNSLTNQVAYVNSVIQSRADENYISGNTTSSSRIKIGGRYGRYASYMTGKICSVRIYNRLLTDSEVAQNFEIDKEIFGIGAQ